jgi:hypothetical protein
MDWRENQILGGRFSVSCPQLAAKAAYSGLQKILQQEWQFVLRVTKNIRPEFEAVEPALLSRTFLPTLFEDCYEDDEQCLLYPSEVGRSGYSKPYTLAQQLTSITMRAFDMLSHLGRLSIIQNISQS